MDYLKSESASVNTQTTMSKTTDQWSTVSSFIINYSETISHTVSILILPANSEPSSTQSTCIFWMMPFVNFTKVWWTIWISWTHCEMNVYVCRNEDSIWITAWVSCVNFSSCDVITSIYWRSLFRIVISTMSAGH